MIIDFRTKLKTRLAESKEKLEIAIANDNKVEEIAWRAAVYELEWTKKELES